MVVSSGDREKASAVGQGSRVGVAGYFVSIDFVSGKLGSVGAYHHWRCLHGKYVLNSFEPAESH